MRVRNPRLGQLPLLPAQPPAACHNGSGAKEAPKPVLFPQLQAERWAFLTWTSELGDRAQVHGAG